MSTQRLKPNDRQKSSLSLIENIKNEERVIYSSHSTLSHTNEDISFLPEENSEPINKNTLSNNVDSLYMEILFQILYNCEDLSARGIPSENLLDLLRNAFKISREKHGQLLNIAKCKNAPTFILNVGIVKLKELLPNDYKGVSGYFVTLYIQSDVVNQFHTKSITSDLTWDEFFSFPLRGDPKKEILVVEVCKLLSSPNYSDENSQRSLNGTLNRSSTIRTLKNAMKKITPTPSMPKAFKLMGKVEIPLKSITGSDSKFWYTFKKRKTQKRGSILMQLSISVEKHCQVVAQEHQHLLMRILSYEQEKSNSSYWNGKLSIEADAIIIQHYVQSGLSRDDDSFMKWIAYTCIHEKQHLSFGLLKVYLQKIIKILPNLGNECVQSFWESLQRILPSCFEIVWKIRDEFFTEKQGIAMLIDALGILQQIESLSVPTDVELLPSSTYGWLKKHEDKTALSITQILNELIRRSTTEWIVAIKEDSELENADVVQQTIKIIQNICFDMKRSVDFHHKHFYQIIKLNYACILYECYKDILLEYCKPVVIEACKNLVPLRVVDVDDLNNLAELSNTSDSTTTKTTHMQLLEIYLVFKRLVLFGSNLRELEEEIKCLAYYDWFSPAVPFWVETAIEKALLAIKKAIDLDEFKPIDENVRHSSSALDTLSIFYQIKVFWEQFDWPNVETMFIYFERVLDGICKCCTYYATNISKSVSQFNGKGDKLTDYQITKEWCVVMCNINEIENKFSSVTNDMGVESIIETIKTERCVNTIKTIVLNCEDILQNEILNLAALMVDEIIRMIQNFLVLNVDSLIEDICSLEDLFLFLDENLSILHDELVETTFDSIIENLYQKLLLLFHKIAQNSLDIYRPSSFFMNLHKVVDIITASFKNDQKPFSQTTSETLTATLNLLDLHASTTETLIHQYYKERLQKEKFKTSSSSHGQLTIKAHISNKNILHVTVLNGKSILPASSKKSPSSYVKLNYVPSDRFFRIPAQQTAVQSKTIYPLYDEEFEVHLSSSQQKQDDNILVFTVKARDYFKMSNKYLSECYLSFGDIRNSDNKQVHLNLFRPDKTVFDSNMIRVLEYRQFFDKTARTFINKLNERSTLEI